jgi:TolB protein
MNADGTDPTQLTDNPGGDLAPAWSPNGHRIVYRSVRPTGQGDIYVVRSDGSHERQLTDDPAADAFPDWQPVPTPAG